MGDATRPSFCVVIAGITVGAVLGIAPLMTVGVVLGWLLVLPLGPLLLGSSFVGYGKAESAGILFEIASSLRFERTLGLSREM
jgi:hypothetical protein